MLGIKKSVRYRNYYKNRIRYVYILYIDNRNKKAKYTGRVLEYYTGQTSNIGRRYVEHLQNRGCKHLKMSYRNAVKKLVFIKTIIGTEPDALKLEKQIKGLSHADKKALVESEENDLVGLNIKKCILSLKKVNNKEEEILIKFGKWILPNI